MSYNACYITNNYNHKVYSDEEIESVLLAYINQAAALFHIPSLGQQVDIMITYLGMKRFVCLEMA